MKHEVVIPKLDVNTDYVVFNKWLVNEGAFVKPGNPLCIIESTKATTEILSENEGYINNLLYSAGDEIPIPTIIAYIEDNQIEPVITQKKPEVKTATTELKINATVKATELARNLNIDLTKIEKKGIILEKDVLAYSKQKPAFDSTSTDLPELTDQTEKKTTGLINPQFLEFIKKEENFKRLSSDLKIMIYRQNGAVIGENVRFDKNCLLHSNEIKIGNNTTIGRDTYIECDQFITGDYVQIGKSCEFVTGKIEISDAVTIAEKVKVDLSGGKSASSSVYIGKGSLICGESYLNAARSIKIGNNVALSPKVIIYTHSYWQSIFDGYPAVFNDVTVKDNSWIGSAAQLLPGITIGSGSIVMSNSLVTANIPDFVMAGGVPAIIIKKELKKELSLPSKQKLLKNLIEEFFLLLREKEVEVTEKREIQNLYLIKSPGHNCAFKLRLIDTDSFNGKYEKDILYIGFNLTKMPDDIQSIDLQTCQIRGTENNLSHELRNFLRRKGVIFSPELWRFDFKKGL